MESLAGLPVFRAALAEGLTALSTSHCLSPLAWPVRAPGIQFLDPPWNHGVFAEPVSPQSTEGLLDRRL